MRNSLTNLAFYLFRQLGKSVLRCWPSVLGQARKSVRAFVTDIFLTTWDVLSPSTVIDNRTLLFRQ